MSNLLEMFMKTDILEGIQEIDRLSGLEFEEFCAELLEAEGYQNIKITQGSGDHGVDITADKSSFGYAIQCKRYSGNVGNSAIQQIYSGKAIYHKDKALVITNSDFTPQAMKDAITLEVELWNRGTLINKIEKYKTKRQKEEAEKKRQEEIRRQIEAQKQKEIKLQQERELEQQQKKEERLKREAEETEEKRKHEAEEIEKRRNEQFKNGIIYLKDILFDSLYERDGSLRLVIGKDHYNKAVITSLNKAPNILVAGNNIANIINSFIISLLISATDFRLILIGSRPEYSSYNVPPIIEHKRPVSEALEAIRWLEDVLIKRKSKLLHDGISLNYPYIICIIDELSEAVAADPGVIDSLIAILKEGSDYKIHLIIGTQIPNEYVLPKRLRDLLPVRFCLYGLSYPQVKLIVEHTYTEELSKFSECFFINNQEQLFRVITPIISPEDIQNAVACVMKDFSDVILKDSMKTSLQEGNNNCHSKTILLVLEKIKLFLANLIKKP